MMIQCHHCGSQVRVTRTGTGGLVAGIAMMLVLGVGSIVVYRTLYDNTSSDAAAIGSHIRQIGDSR